MLMYKLLICTFRQDYNFNSVNCLFYSPTSAYTLCASKFKIKFIFKSVYEFTTANFVLFIFANLKDTDTSAKLPFFICLSIVIYLLKILFI